MVDKLLEVCKMTPFLESSTDICLPLTFFDLLWLRYQPIELLFFYEYPSHPELFFSTILPKLKHSLSLTLEHFFPVTGNLVWPPSSPKPFIRYQKEDGLIVTIAESDADFFHLSSNKFRKANTFRSLKANISVSDSQAQVLAIKLTLFPNKGFCIGITEHHVVFDQTSFTMFIKTWASLAKLNQGKNQNTESQPIFERKLIRERYQGLENIYIDTLMKQNRANPRSLSTHKLESQPYDLIGAFQLSGLDVKRLKGCIRAQFQLHKYKEFNHDLHISTFTVTYAYLIVCLAKAKEQTENNVSFSIVADFRGRLEPSIPATYFGTCIGFFGGDVEREKLIRHDGIVAAIHAVSRTMKGLKDGVLKGAEKWIDSIEKDSEKGTRISLSGSTKLKMYDVDFGLGKPKKYFNSSIEKSGSISLAEGRDGDGGVEIELCLGKHEMEKFASTFAQGLMEIKPIKAAM